MNFSWKKKLKSFSLLEMIVTLAIVAIIMVMLTDILLLSLEISRKSYARSLIREEQTNILNKLEKDIRNARYVENCIDQNCNVALDKMYEWSTCVVGPDNVSGVCKSEFPGTDREKLIESTSADITIDLFDIDVGVNTSTEEQVVVVTMVSSYDDSRIKIENQVRQVVVSTRNYKF